MVSYIPYIPYIQYELWSYIPNLPYLSCIPHIPYIWNTITTPPIHTIPNIYAIHTIPTLHSKHSTPIIVTIHTIQTIHTVISNMPYPTDLHTLPTIHTVPHPHHTTGGRGTVLWLTHDHGRGEKGGWNAGPYVYMCVMHIHWRLDYQRVNPMASLPIWQTYEISISRCKNHAGDQTTNIQLVRLQIQILLGIHILTHICNNMYIYIAGWWFGIFLIFPHIGNNHPNWLIFFRGVATTNQYI